MLPWWLRGQSICLQCRRPRFNPWVGRIPWRRKWQPTLVFLPGESHGQRSLEATVHRVAKSRTRLSDFTSLCKFYLWYYHYYLGSLMCSFSPQGLFLKKKIISTNFITNVRNLVVLDFLLFYN